MGDRAGDAISMLWARGNGLKLLDDREGKRYLSDIVDTESDLNTSIDLGEVSER